MRRQFTLQLYGLEGIVRPTEPFQECEYCKGPLRWDFRHGGSVGYHSMWMCRAYRTFAVEMDDLCQWSDRLKAAIRIHHLYTGNGYGFGKPEDYITPEDSSRELAKRMRASLPSKFSSPSNVHVPLTAKEVADRLASVMPGVSGVTATVDEDDPTVINIRAVHFGTLDEDP